MSKCSLCHRSIEEDSQHGITCRECLSYSLDNFKESMKKPETSAAFHSIQKLMPDLSHAEIVVLREAMLKMQWAIENKLKEQLINKEQ